MEQLYITNVTIEKVRHLKDISIPLADDRIRHLILTGKNGSGKTSVVESLAEYLNNVYYDEYFERRKEWLESKKRKRDQAIKEGADESEILKLEKEMHHTKEDLERSRAGLELQFNKETGSIHALKEKYHYILAFYRADRIFKAEQPKHVEKIQLRDDYDLQEFPRDEFVKYLLDLKMTEALASNNGNSEKADEIREWFDKLEELMKEVFADDTVQLVFDEDSFQFHILQQGKEPFDFNTLSSGYQAVFDIVLDIIMRMQNQTKRSFDFNLSGIVLIDEIETHLHLALQKNIMPLLTTIFPNIQFVVTSHSPFILNSLENAVIYDLENHTLVRDGLDDVPYDGIVEGYFGADKLSAKLREKFERYKYLVQKEKLSDDEISEIAGLELYLDEVPDYLALDIATEYQKLKLEFMNREDIDG